MLGKLSVYDATTREDAERIAALHRDAISAHVAAAVQVARREALEEAAKACEREAEYALVNRPIAVESRHHANALKHGARRLRSLVTATADGSKIGPVSTSLSCTQHGDYIPVCPRCDYDASVAREREDARAEIDRLQRRLVEVERELVYLRGPVRPSDDVPVQVLERDVLAAMVASRPTMVLDTSLMDRILGRIRHDAARVGELVKMKDGAYEERNRLVVLFARISLTLGWSAGVGRHDELTGCDHDLEWSTLVVVQTPEGQASWHLHDSHRHLLDGLPDLDVAWDGHDTKTKYERLGKLAAGLGQLSIGRSPHEHGGSEPISMFLTCPGCGARHIDEGEFATKVHHTHSCQACGLTWRPAVVPTFGVHFLPGFKSSENERAGDGIKLPANGVVTKLPAKGYVHLGDQRMEISAGDVLYPTYDEWGNFVGLRVNQS